MRIRMLLLNLAAGVAAVALLPAAHAAGDAKKGADVYAQECAECHSVHEGKNKKGPSLFGVVGRTAASVAAFDYSDSMKASGITWTPAELDAYVSDPHQRVPKGKMKYDGLDSASDRADLIAYLATVH